MAKYTYVATKAEGMKRVSSFRFHPQNRPVFSLDVQKLKKELFKNGTWNLTCPIIVNIITGHIIDGQHRRAVWMELVNTGVINPFNDPLLVQYIKCNPEDEIELIHELQNAKHWTEATHIESYVRGNNPNYVKLQNFCATHTLCHRVKKDGEIASYAYRLAGMMMTGKRQSQEMVNGTYIFSEDEAKTAGTIHDQMNKIINVLGIKNPSQAGLEGLAQVWYRDNGMFPFSTWMKELKKDKWYGGPNTQKTKGKATWDEFLGKVETSINRQAYAKGV